MSLMALLSFLKRTLLDLLFPVSCLGCASAGAFLCRSCRTSLQWLPPQCAVCKILVPGTNHLPPGRTCARCRKKSHLFAFLSPFSYDLRLPRELIHGLKYQRLRSLAPLLAGLLGEYLSYFGVTLPAESVIVPVPLHPKRERVRGFNQAELIARELGAGLGLRVVSLALAKVRDTRAQVLLGAEERRDNLSGAFASPRPELIGGKIVILLDDVKTTGTTVEEAARALTYAGAKQVWAITVAH